MMDMTWQPLSTRLLSFVSKGFRTGRLLVQKSGDLGTNLQA
jgi:hypothetical protein